MKPGFDYRKPLLCMHLRFYEDPWFTGSIGHFKRGKWQDGHAVKEVRIGARRS